MQECAYYWVCSTRWVDSKSLKQFEVSTINTPIDEYCKGRVICVEDHTAILSVILLYTHSLSWLDLQPVCIRRVTLDFFLFIANLIG